MVLVMRFLSAEAESVLSVVLGVRTFCTEETRLKIEFDIVLPFISTKSPTIKLLELSVIGILFLSSTMISGFIVKVSTSLELLSSIGFEVVILCDNAICGNVFACYRNFSCVIFCINWSFYYYSKGMRIRFCCFLDSWSCRNWIHIVNGLLQEYEI